MLLLTPILPNHPQSLAGGEIRIPAAARGKRGANQEGSAQARQLDSDSKALLRGPTLCLATGQRYAGSAQQLRQGPIDSCGGQRNGLSSGAGPRGEVVAGHGVPGDAQPCGQSGQSVAGGLHRNKECPEDLRTEAGGGQQSGGQTAVTAQGRHSIVQVGRTFTFTIYFYFKTSLVIWLNSISVQFAIPAKPAND